MPGLYSRLKVWITNEVLTHTDLNAEFDNVKTNFTPQMLDDYSSDSTQMKIQTSPGAQGSESLATSASGEIERIRYVLNRAIGGTYWYDAPAISLATANTNINSITQIPTNRITTGKLRTTSAFPIFLRPSGTTNSVTLKADSSTNLFTYFINSTQYTISSDTSFTGLSTAPSSNNTATLSGNITATQGEIGLDTVITMSSVGSEISALVGKYAAFKLGTEYFIARVASSTTLDQAYRGYFFDSSDAPISRAAANNGDTITLMKLTYVFAKTDGTLDVSYNQPYYQVNTPSGASSGDYWFDQYNSLWKKYNGSSWVTANAVIIGTCIQNTTATIGARSYEIYKNFGKTNSIFLYKDTAGIAKSTAIGHKISVNGSMYGNDFSRWTWDMSSDRDTGVSDSNSVTYYFYVTERGNVIISDVAPYYRIHDLFGYYHPYQMWRAVAKMANDGSANFDETSLYNYRELEPVQRLVQSSSTVTVVNRNIGIVNLGTDFSTSSTSYTDSGLQAVFKCYGNPIMVILTGESGQDGTRIYVTYGATGQQQFVAIFRDSTSIVSHTYGAVFGSGMIQGEHPLSITTIDNPGYGTFTYKVRLKVSNAASAIQLTRPCLIVKELK